jgi:hypothetical protein
VGRIDADGQALETIADVASIGWSTYDLIKNPSWANVGYLAWDIGATVVPFVPGSYVAKGIKAASKGIKAVKVAKATTKAGNTIAAKTGKLRHAELAAKARSKGWKAEVTIVDRKTGKRYRVDAMTPSGNPIELKPDTPRGRARGKSQLRTYERITGKKGRVIYYKP